MIDDPVFWLGAGAMMIFLIARRANREIEQSRQMADEWRELHNSAADQRDRALGLVDRGEEVVLRGTWERFRDQGRLVEIDADIDQAAELIGDDGTWLGIVFPDDTWIGGRN